MEQMIERKLSWIERLRKRIYLRFMKADSIKRFHNLPHFLKYDREVIEQLFSKCREKVEDEANGFGLGYKRPQCINFSPEMIDLISEVPYSITLLNIEELKKLMQSNNEFQKYTSLLPVEMQIEVLNNTSKTDISNFPDEVIVNYFLNAKKNGEMIAKDKFNIQEFSEEIQLKIGLIDNNYLRYMTPEIQSKFIHGNKLVVKLLNIHIANDEYAEYGKNVNEVIKTDDMSFLKSIFTKRRRKSFLMKILRSNKMV